MNTAPSTSASWVQDYLEQYRTTIYNDAVNRDLALMAQKALKAHAADRQLIFAGNGGSAAMSSHCAVDFTKTAGVRAICFNESDLITCFANDYGYEHWMEKALEFYGKPGDQVVLISSSGRSPNILQAAQFARTHGMDLTTFSGFDSDNPLRKLGSLNFWVDSHRYNVVENTHQVWLLAVCDLLIHLKKESHS